MKRMVICCGLVLLACAMVTALAYCVPAAWLAQHVAGASSGRVQIAHARGLWHDGSGILVLSSGAGGADAAHWMQPVRWNATSTLWPVRWSLRVMLPEAGPPLALTLHAGYAGWAIDVAPWRGMVPLAALAGLGAPFNTLGLEGEAQIELSAQHFSAQSENRTASAPPVQIHVRNLRSALAQGVVLGDYLVHGGAGVGGVTFVLRTAQGVLHMEGQGRCAAAKRWSCGFEGVARATRHDDALIGNLLGLLGRQRLLAAQSTQGVHGAGNNFITELRW